MYQLVDNLLPNCAEIKKTVNIMSVLHKLLSKQIIIFKQFDKVSCSQINRFRQLSIHYSNNDTNNNIVRSPFADVQIPSVSIPEYIYSQTEQFGKFVALVSIYIIKNIAIN